VVRPLPLDEPLREVEIGQASARGGGQRRRRRGVATVTTTEMGRCVSALIQAINQMNVASHPGTRL